MKSPSEHVECFLELTSMVILQLVNHVYFSPDGQWLASASFDKSVKLWNGITGKFVASFRGHVGPVYQIRSFDSLPMDILISPYCFFSFSVNIFIYFILFSPCHSWSADSRLLLSGSKDSTLKVFSYLLVCFLPFKKLALS